MFSNKNDRNRYAMVEALNEPAYLFAKDGKALYHSEQAAALMADHLLPFDRMPDLHDFSAAMKPLLPADGTAEFTIGGGLYAYESSVYSEGVLVRFHPLKDAGHISRLSASLDHVPWGLMTLDVTANVPEVIFCNLRICDYLQMNPSTIIHHNAANVFRIFGIEQNLQPRYTGHETSHVDIEQHAGGRDVWYRLHFIPYKQDRNYCLVVMEDTTEGKIREGKYFQSQRLEALGQLAGGVAHDFNNLLSIIDGYARLAKQEIDKNNAAQNCLDRIMQTVQRGASVTNHLLTFGSHKIVNGAVTDLGRLVEDQQVLLAPLLDASITLSIHVEDNLFIDAPEDAICQILLNLSINSRDSMPDGGHLIVEAARKNEKIFLRIIDTGCGMSPETKSRMFDPFFTTKDQGKGTGLGLSMVYGLVKDLRGDIDVVSKLGEGTSITIWLPPCKNIQSSVTVQEVDSDDISLEGLTILIAEDEPDLLETLSSGLESAGLHVLKALNGNQALQIQNEYDAPIDFLLTDVVMPGLNGVKLSELFAEVRPESKIIFMSGYPANGQMARVPLPDNTLLLPKPVQFESMVHVLKRMSGQVRDDNAQSLKSMTGHWRNA